MNDVELMRLAIEQARAGIAAGQSPFGAVVVRNDIVVAARHNTVWRDGDPTAHAEVNAIREAAATLQTINLSGATIYTTCEPCPMCLSAIHWSKIDRVVFGAMIADAALAGFRELHIDSSQMVTLGGSRLVVDSGPCRDECRRLFDEWKAAGLCMPY